MNLLRPAQLPKPVRPLVGPGIILVAFFLSLLFLSPMAKKAKILWHEIHALEGNVRSVRGEVQALRPFANLQDVLTPSTIAEALDELTRKAGEESVMVRSFHSEPLEPPSEHLYSHLPVKIEVETTYGNLERFLAALSGMRHSHLLVKSISFARNPAILPRIRAKIQLDIYILEKT